MTDPLGCTRTWPLLAELATGAAVGHDRALALAHVAGCPACHQELAELAKVADELLLLAPSVEPPAGFESAVLARLDGRVGRAARPRRARLLAAVAAVLLAVVSGGGLVWWHTAPDRALAEHHRQTLAVANGRYLRAVALTTDAGMQVGTVFLYQGTPSWLLVTVSGAPADGRYEIVAVDRSGGTHRLGVCVITDRAGTTGYRLDLPVATVGEVRLRGPDGASLTARA